MKIRSFLAALCALAATMTALAEAPEGYYNSLNGLKEGELKTAVYNRIHNFRTVSSYSNLPQYFRVTDVYPESNRWWDMYANTPRYTYNDFKGLNREHSFPKSWWKQNNDVEYTTAYVDLNHLYPADAAANQAKSNFPLGELDPSINPTFDNGVSRVGYPAQGQGGGASKVFEPDDQYKGDFARTYFYMVTCYQDLKWNQSYMFMLNQNLYPTLNAWSVRLLLKWHREDPVSQKELDRNEVVYSFQDNRNPFIDCPDLVEYIWGDKAGLPYQAGSTGGDPVADAELEAPVNRAGVGSSATAKLFFKGANIRQPLTLRIYRGDTGMFSTPVNTISTSLVNSAEGTWLTLTYKPTELGQHTARLLINGTGVDGNGSRGVELRGECLERPTLTAPVATAATDITATSYTANWTPAEGDVVDYYVVTRTRYNAGIPTVEEIVADETGIVIDEFDLSDSESYSVHSVRLGVESPESNVIFVSHAGITDAAVEHPLEVLAGAGAIALRSTVGVENVRVYDVAGREVAYLPEVLGLVEVQLPAGVYMVAGGYGTEPVKVVVR